MNSHNFRIKGAVTFILAVFVLFFCFDLSLSQPVMLVKDIRPGEEDGVSAVTPALEVNGVLFFEGNDGTTGNELWKSDGSPTGTVVVRDIVPGTIGSEPQDLTEVDGTLFFVANDEIHSWELWKSDGTAAGTMLVRDIYPGGGPNPSYPDDLTDFNGTLFFSADDAITGNELWKSDGTAEGTVLVKDIRPGSSGSLPLDLTVANGLLFFRVGVGTAGLVWKELWKSDGTAEGTVLVKDTFDDNIGLLFTDVNGTLFFSGDDNTNGRELWKSDGTTSGTVLAKDINPGPADGIHNGYSAGLNGRLFFAADDGTTGDELWKSDGTKAGTVLVKDINPAPGMSSSFPTNLTNVNGTLFFAADNGATGWELWKSDGTTAGTVLVKDINPGTGSSNPNQFTNIDGTIYFSADDGTHGWELWKSDGTAPGTMLVQDLNPGNAPSRPHLTAVNDTLFFDAWDGAIGNELWALQAPITTTVNPVNPPIQIPPAGGSFNFDATLANISGRAETRDVWNVITAPNGASFTTIGPATLTLPSGFSGMKTLSQQIPGGAPVGQYTYAFNVGAYPDTIESSDSFTFTKSVSPTALQNSEPTEAGGWAVLDAQTGQPFNFEDWHAKTLAKTTQEEPLPQEFELQQNYPNPFNPSTTISFSLPEASNVTLAIYNLRGQLVRTLHSGPMAAGNHRVAWDGADTRGARVASGVYLYRLEARGGAGERFVAANKLVLMK